MLRLDLSPLPPCQRPAHFVLTRNPSALARTHAKGICFLGRCRSSCELHSCPYNCAPRGFKALKQLVKLYYKMKRYDKMMESYR
eukprot:364902-Chlamydomonas_euryale.AAC.2